MGFFQDLKEDLSQAVTELMDEDADKGQPVETENIEESNMEEETIEQDMEVAEMSFIENLPEQAEDEEKTLKDVQSETEHNLEAEIADFLKAQETLETEEETVEEESYLDTLPVLNKELKVDTKMA